MGDIFWGALPKKEILFLGGGAQHVAQTGSSDTIIAHCTGGQGNNDPDQECALFK